ncbi:hypothetical protein PCH_Pc22g03410 [Penicillium rubens Wisconsin 54-1255]|uniref:Uncharacterized protein n=1 Tax=Penicillium rubens (strain ATCC 28089 / DSM 1075 / NRRL 1951 / Wisconsin 54-1255) TaxID=500485 RepID=B6HRD0_PENRW|nr:hypothetical protein PCH_Pc22g03410 [Penicillium rubens Wisconsin 54-1255]
MSRGIYKLIPDPDSSGSSDQASPKILEMLLNKGSKVPFTGRAVDQPSKAGPSQDLSWPSSVTNESTVLALPSTKLPYRSSDEYGHLSTSPIRISSEYQRSRQSRRKLSQDMLQREQEKRSSAMELEQDEWWVQTELHK